MHVVCWQSAHSLTRRSVAVERIPVRQAGSSSSSCTSIFIAKFGRLTAVVFVPPRLLRRTSSREGARAGKRDGLAVMLLSQPFRLQCLLIVRL